MIKTGTATVGSQHINVTATAAYTHAVGFFSAPGVSMVFSVFAIVF
jgi:hypothetical protein